MQPVSFFFSKYILEFFDVLQVKRIRIVNKEYALIDLESDRGDFSARAVSIDSMFILQSEPFYTPFCIACISAGKSNAVATRGKLRFI